VFLVVKEY